MNPSYINVACVPLQCMLLHCAGFVMWATPSCFAPVNNAQKPDSCRCNTSVIIILINMSEHTHTPRRCGINVLCARICLCVCVCVCVCVRAHARACVCARACVSCVFISFIKSHLLLALNLNCCCYVCESALNKCTSLRLDANICRAVARFGKEYCAQTS